MILILVVVVCENPAHALEETCSGRHGLAVYLVSRIDHVDDVGVFGTGSPLTRNDFGGVVDGTGVCHAHPGLFLATCAVVVVVVLDPSPPAPLCASELHYGYLSRG